MPRLALQAACRAADEPLEGGHSPDRLCCRQRWSWPHPGRAPPARQPPPSAAARRRASPLLLSGVRPRVAAQYSVGRGWWLPLDDDRSGLARRPPLCLPPEVARRPSFLLMTTGRRTREPRDGDRRERPPGSASFSIAAAVPSSRAESRCEHVGLDHSSDQSVEAKEAQRHPERGHVRLALGERALAKADAETSTVGGGYKDQCCTSGCRLSSGCCRRVLPRKISQRSQRALARHASIDEAPAMHGQRKSAKVAGD